MLGKLVPKKVGETDSNKIHFMIQYSEITLLKKY